MAISDRPKTVGLALVFGFPEDGGRYPKAWIKEDGLPEMRTDPDGWLIIIDNNGKEYFADTDRGKGRTFYPRRCVPEGGDESVHPPGKVWVDTDHPAHFEDKDLV